MQKIIVPASKCIPGMITAAPVIDLKNGTTILGVNQTLTSENIKNIRNFVHNDIWVYLDSFNKVWQLSNETIESYKQYSNTLMAVLSHFDPKELKSIQDLENLCEKLPIDFKANYSLLGCTNLIEQLDYNTFNHSLNVAFIAMVICRWCHLDASITNNALKAGLLHDIGILNLSFNPYKTKEPWTKEQEEEYQKHPIYSYNIVSKINDLDPMISKAILAHHEHCDCTGYPLHISSPYINDLGKVLALAAIYEDLRHQTHIFNVLQILLEERISQYEPRFLLKFCFNLASYYVGSFVILSNGQIGEVVFINPVCLYRPIVKINETFINLYERSDIHIVAIK